MRLNYYQAALYSTKAGYNKQIFAFCSHQHQSWTLANNCARRLQKTNTNNRRIWRVAEIVLRPAKAREPSAPSTRRVPGRRRP